MSFVRILSSSPTWALVATTRGHINTLGAIANATAAGVGPVAPQVLSALLRRRQ